MVDAKYIFLHQSDWRRTHEARIDHPRRSGSDHRFGLGLLRLLLSRYASTKSPVSAPGFFCLPIHRSQFGETPHWSRVDETSGEPVDNYGGELSIAVDRELIKDRVFGALNFVYDPELTRSRITGLWQREATLGWEIPEIDFNAASRIVSGAFAEAGANHGARINQSRPVQLAVAHQHDFANHVGDPLALPR